MKKVTLEQAILEVADLIKKGYKLEMQDSFEGYWFGLEHGADFIEILGVE